jgi:hypothetical protein
MVDIPRMKLATTDPWGNLKGIQHSREEEINTKASPRKLDPKMSSASLPCVSAEEAGGADVEA